MNEPEWTRGRPSLKQKSIIDYTKIYEDSRKASGDVHTQILDVQTTFFAWMEFGRTCKLTRSRKRIIKKWCFRPVC